MAMHEENALHQASADGAVAGMTLPPGHARVVRDRVLVAVPLIAHTLAFERLILGRRNFQFLVSKVAPDPVPKHLDIVSAFHPIAIKSRTSRHFGFGP
jgi:hypothetical protein